MEGSHKQLNFQNLREIYAHYHQLEQDGEWLSETAANNDTIKSLLLSNALPWAHYYDLPYPVLITLFVEALDISFIFSELHTSKKPVETILHYLNTEEEIGVEMETLDEDEQGFILALLICFMGQIRSVSMFSQLMTDLIIKARNGDDDSLFNAILVDRSVIATPSISRRIQFAQITDDEAFMDQLSRSIKKSRPRRPAPEYDHLRTMIELTDEITGLNNFKHEELYDFLAVDMQLYPESTNDPFSGLKKFIQRRNKSKRT